MPTKAQKEFADRRRLGMSLEEYRNRPKGPATTPPKLRIKPQEVPSYKRHSKRRCCSYCGVVLGPQSILPGLRQGDTRTWDHIVPKSVGGKLLIPCCYFCNNAKGDRSLTEFLTSTTLRLRTAMVSERELDPDPMSPKVLTDLRDEEIYRLRRTLEYHAN